jgi:hypothetical protein
VIATDRAHQVVEVSPVYAVREAMPVRALCHVIIELGGHLISIRKEEGWIVTGTDQGRRPRYPGTIRPTIAIDCGDAVNHQQESTAARVSDPAGTVVLDGPRTTRRMPSTMSGPGCSPCRPRWEVRHDRARFAQ